MPRETEEDYVARVNILYARSKQPSTTGDIDRATRSRTGGLATQTTLDANLGTAARLQFEQQTGLKEKQPTSITACAQERVVVLYKVRFTDLNGATWGMVGPHTSGSPRIKPPNGPI